MSGRGKVRYTRRYQALFSEDQWEWLSQWAHADCVSVADVLRQLVDEKIKECGK